MKVGKQTVVTVDIDLNENVSHSPMYLNIWSSVDGPVWRDLGGEALLEEVCQQTQALGV